MNSWRAVFADTLDCAYAAGILDGEGSIVIARTRIKVPVQFGLVVAIGNTDLLLLEWLRARWSGSIIRRKSYSVKHRPFWTWTVRSREAETFLRDVRSHVQVKSRQADLAIAFQNTKRNTGGRPHSTAEREAHLVMFDHLHTLNHSPRKKEA